jgi:hypothetical protein
MGYFQKLSENISFSFFLRELQRDPVIAAIPKELHADLVNIAWKIGSCSAKRIIKEYGARIPTEIAKKMSIKIIHVYDNNIKGDVKLRSEYIPNPPTILLHENSILEVVALAKRNSLSNISYDLAVEIHVGHELFHHLEATKIGSVSEMLKVITLRFGPFRITSKIRSLSEIAAHAFVMELLNCKCLPKLLGMLTFY